MIFDNVVVVWAAAVLVLKDNNKDNNNSSRAMLGEDFGVIFVTTTRVTSSRAGWLLRGERPARREKEKERERERERERAEDCLRTYRLLP